MTQQEDGSGQNPSERYVSRLCRRTFLHLWSYPNVYKTKSHGQELCDLLVVFGDDVVIVSVKHCEYPNTGNAALDWSRWYRRAIEHSADQLYTAERWLLTCPSRISLDAKGERPFPIPIPPVQAMRVHRVAVAVGSGVRNKAALGGSGSLMVRPDVAGKDHLGTSFSVGTIRPGKGFVHVLDEIALDAVMTELDTIADFVSYLSKKEELIRSGRLLGAAGEEDLLAYYLEHCDQDGHRFHIPEGASGISIAEGFWRPYRDSAAYRRKRVADEPSYVWDRFINYTAGFAEDPSNPESGFSDREAILRIMAGEPRIKRRILGRMLLALEVTAHDQRRLRIQIDPRTRDAYLLLLVPCTFDSYADYRSMRHKLLMHCCMLVGLERPDLSRIIGISREPFASGGGTDGSEDFVLYDVVQLSADQISEVRRVQDVFGFLKGSEWRSDIEHEYPAPHRDAATLPVRSRSRDAFQRRKRRLKDSQHQRRKNRR